MKGPGTSKTRPEVSSTCGPTKTSINKTNLSRSKIQDSRSSRVLSSTTKQKSYHAHVNAPFKTNPSLPAVPKKTGINSSKFPKGNDRLRISEPKSSFGKSGMQIQKAQGKTSSADNKVIQEQQRGIVSDKVNSDHNLSDTDSHSSATDSLPCVQATHSEHESDFQAAMQNKDKRKPFSKEIPEVNKEGKPSETNIEQHVEKKFILQSDGYVCFQKLQHSMFIHVLF